MGILSSLRAVRALPDLAAAQAGHVEVASPWAAYPSHLNQVVWPDLVGLEHILPMTRIEAMSVPAMARARRIIAGSIARMPLRAYIGDDLADTQPVWLDRTDDPRHLSPFHRMLWTVDDLIFWGWSLWTLERSGTDGPVVRADRAPWDTWDFDTDGNIRVEGKYPDPRTVCLIPGLDEGVLYTGRGTLQHARRLLTSSDKAATTPTPQLELHQTTDVPMPDEEVRALIDGWAAARRGENGGVAFTNAAVETKEHRAADGHLLIEGRNAAAVDVARVAGVPATMIDASPNQASLTYSTSEGRNVELVDYGLAPFMSAISARLGMDDMVPHGWRIAFDAEDFVGPDVRVQVPDDGGPMPPARNAAPGLTPGPGAAPNQEIRR